MQAQAALKTPYHTDISLRHFALVADEPPEKGGADHGAKPREMVLGALCACTAMTLRMYADRKGYDMGEVVVKADHHDVDPTPGAPRDHITLTLHFEKPQAEDVAQRLLAIAGKCPVHRMLTPGCAIGIRLG